MGSYKIYLRHHSTDTMDTGACIDDDDCPLCFLNEFLLSEPLDQNLYEELLSCTINDEQESDKYFTGIFSEPASSPSTQITKDVSVSSVPEDNSVSTGNDFTRAEVLIETAPSDQHYPLSSSVLDKESYNLFPDTYSITPSPQILRDAVASTTDADIGTQIDGVTTITTTPRCVLDEERGDSFQFNNLSLGEKVSSSNVVSDDELTQTPHGRIGRKRKKKQHKKPRKSERLLLKTLYKKEGIFRCKKKFPLGGENVYSLRVSGTQLVQDSMCKKYQKKKKKKKKMQGPRRSKRLKNLIS